MHYKFLDKSALKSVMDGNFLLSKLSYFALMEAVSRERGIGDVGEGTSVRIIDNVKIGLGPISPEVDRRLRKAGAIVRNANINISNVAIHHRVECYVFSMSCGNLDKIVKSTSGRKEFPYRSCVEIFDVTGLEKALREEGFFRDFSNLSVDGEHVTTKFRQFEQGLVTYKSNLETISDQCFGDIEPYFIKDPCFEYQSEFRFVFLPCNDVDPDRIIVTIPNARRFINELYSYDPEVSLQSTEPTYTIEQLYTKLKRIDLYHLEHKTNAELYEIVKQTTKISWYARKLLVRNLFLESIIIEPDVVYGRRLDVKQIKMIVEGYLTTFKNLL